MNKTFGIRHEDKYALERRVAIIPSHLKKLIDNGLKAVVESSAKRVFTDSSFKDAGAEINDNLEECDVIFGVKEMPLSLFEKDKTYIFFSHVIKGQSYNMPMLKRMMDRGANLIDYEKVTDEMGRRLIFFGRFAGLAGMINSLWSLGMRYEKMGIDTPFNTLKQSHKYSSLAEAQEAISQVGMAIAKDGLPDAITPLTFGITGYGNVAKGAQEILNLLPVMEITPDQLVALRDNDNLPNNLVYKTVFMEKDISVHKVTPEEFDLENYYAHPEEYDNAFERYIPHISCLMNCMYWDDRYPRIVTKKYLKDQAQAGGMKLTVIGDVTCDPDGSIECTHKGTEIEDPVFIYNPISGDPTSGFAGEGVLVMSVDILPSELPKESSEAFSNALRPYVKKIITCDYGISFNELDLPAPIKRAMILHKGKLTPDYEYLKEYVEC